MKLFKPKYNETEERLNEIITQKIDLQVILGLVKKGDIKFNRKEKKEIIRKINYWIYGLSINFERARIAGIMGLTKNIWYGKSK